MTLALLCSGQGPQHPQMFALTGDAPAAANLFAHAAALLGGRDPREIVRTEPDEVFHQNVLGQLLCTLQAVAATAALGDAVPFGRIVAGYSIGEVAAWGVAGFIEPSAVLDLALCRARAMDAASSAGDGLLFVRGLARGMIDDLCNRFDAAIAIVNPGDAFVLGGNEAALDALGEAARVVGAIRVVRIPVTVASHTPRLTAASTEFRRALSRASIIHAVRRGARLISGIDGAAVLETKSGLDKLAEQISHTVEWATCLESCVEAGATGFLELGPGRALSEMASHAYPSLPARSLDEFTTLQGARTWLEFFAG